MCKFSLTFWRILTRLHEVNSTIFAQGGLVVTGLNCCLGSVGVGINEMLCFFSAHAAAEAQEGGAGSTPGYAALLLLLVSADLINIPLKKLR